MSFDFHIHVGAGCTCLCAIAFFVSRQNRSRRRSSGPRGLGFEGRMKMHESGNWNPQWDMITFDLRVRSMMQGFIWRRKTAFFSTVATSIICHTFFFVSSLSPTLCFYYCIYSIFLHFETEMKKFQITLILLGLA